MSERVNFQELVSLLSEERNITKKDAEVFLRELFALTAEGILNEGNVKIKDCGTFKVTDIGARESVNVRTGERVTISAHKKVSFSPDKKLSALVNAPYAHLEIAELNAEEELVQEKDADKATGTSSGIEKREGKKGVIRRHPIFFAFLLIGLIALFILGIYFFVIKSDRKEYIHTLKEVADRAKTDGQHRPVATNDTILPFSGNASSQTKESDASAQNDSTTTEDGKKPEAEEKTVTISRGERLTLISLREYGDKAFWVYLYIANKDVIDDPNNVSPGTVIKIPPPERYEIDKDNPKSILKAANLMQKIVTSTAK